MTRAACGPAGVARAARLTAFILVLASSLGWASTAEAQGEYASMFDEPQAGAIPMMRNEAALGFVTGAHRAGYTLTSVTLALGSMSADSELMVYLWPAATGGTLPKQSAHSELLELTPPARLLASSNNIFTASPGGAVLAPDTRYFVLLRNTGTDDIEYVTSVSSGETASPGWSIDDRSYGRARSTSSAWGSGSVLKPRMRVDASRNPAPAEDVGLDALALSGVTLEPAFDPATLVYTAAVAQDVVSTTVTATPATGVDASISPADDDSVTLGHQVALSQGSNRITVTVSKAGSTGGGYTVTVTRAPPPTITIEANQTSMGGGLQDLVLTLTRTGATTDLLDVTVEIAQDEAWLSALSHDVTFAAGSATATLTFLDSDFSLDPTMSGNLTATVAAVTGYDVSGAAATVEVIAIDGPPVIVRFDRTAYRFPEGGPAENVEIYLVASLDAAFSMPPVTAFNIRVSTRRGTATSPDDFSAVDQVLRIGGSSYRDEGDGTLVARLPVASTDEPRFVIVDDDVYEDDETLSVLATSGAEDRGLHANARVRRAFADHGYREHNLALPAYARMQRADGTLCESAHTDTCTDMQYPVTITDEDDLPELSLAVWPAFIAEEDDTRTPDITENVSVVTASTAHGKRFASDRTLTLTFAGTASALTHYALAPADEDATTPGHQVTLPARATEVSLTVTATPNDTAAGARTIIVAGSREGRAFGTEQIVTIGDDETSSAATGAPTISGTAQADETLKADISGIADANGLFGVTFSYQWIRVDGTTETDISDETSATYTLAAADVDKTIKVRVSFTDEGGSDEALTSAATATIIAALPGICGRTAQVKDAVVAAITGVADCADVTASHLAGMTQLGINGDLELTSLRVRDFAGLSSLRELKLIRNGLSSVPAGVFAGLSSLRELRLSSNQLSSLPGELFADIPSLRILYLNNNKFDTLEAGVFAELSSLHELYLHSNKFASLKAGVFAGLSSLRQLYLNGNKFASLDAEVFDGLSSVEILWLHENRLNSLPAGLFAGLSSLDRLELNDNELTTLPAGLFTGLSSLRRLYLNDNQLTDLPEDLSNELSSLRILKLRRNSFDCLPDNLVNRTSLNVDITVANFSCPTVTLSLAPASIEEMDDPDTTDESENMATVTATLSAPSSIATTVTISAVPDSPAVEADYVLSTNTDLTVAADTTTSTGDVTITAVDNMILTGERAVTISGAASNARVKVVKDAHLSIEDDEANTALTALTLSDVTLEPSFDSVTTDYVVTDANTIESTTVTATAQSGASAVIAPVDADADAPGHQVALSEGDTTITVTVSKAGSVDVVYTVTVTRQAPATGEPTITGTLRVGEALSADTSDITDANGLGSVSYTYQWVRVDGATETDISGATAATYTLTTDDLGKTIKVDVSFTDDAGHAQGPLASAPAGPVAPGRVADVALTPGVFSLAVGWTAVDGAEGYKVQWRSGGEVFADAGTTGREHSVDGGAATSATIAGLTAGVSHTVRVLATHGTGGDGPASEEAMETPLAATLAIADAAVAEASGAKVTFEVTLSAPAPDEVTVSWSTGDDTDAPEGTGAVAGEDYTAVSSETVRLGAGELSAQIEVAVLDDAFDEHDETFAVTLSGASHNAKLGDATATGTLTDDDAWPAIAPKATTYAVDEGDSVEFVIVLDPVSGRDVTVAYETVAGTAEAGDDYTTVSGTVTFKAGETEKSIPVTTLADAEDDDGETFSLRLSDPVKATLETALAQATIAQVTAPRVTLVLTPDSIRESDDTQQLGEEHVSTVTATVSPAHDQAFTVTVTAAPVSSAVAGDFTLSTNTTLSFAADAGDSTGTVTITAVDNAVHNDDRTVTVSGTASASGVAAPADVTVTIDNEDMRGVTVSVTTLSVPEGGDAQYTVVLDTQPTGDVTVTPALAAGGDTDLTLDSTAALTFTATNWNTPQSVQVNARADTDTANGTATIEHTVAGADVDYASVLAGDVTVTEDDVTTAPCTVDTSGRVEKWSGELTVASHSAGAEFGYGLGAGGALSETDFTIGTSTHTIDTVQVGTDGTLNFGLDGSDDFRDYERDALVLHVCADAFVLKNRDGFLDSDVTYSFNSSGLDWSAATTVSLALSIPANTVATGAPAISGTVQVGEVLTAGAGDIADDDGLGSDVSYSYQWVLVDSGTAADIAGATAATYTVAATHEGKTLKVRASFEDRFGNAETRTSIETAAVTGANAVPAFAVTSETITVDESVGNTGTATSTDIGTALPPATDDDAGDSLTYSLEGTDAASFELDAATRQLKTKTTVVYDFEATPSYSVTLKAQDPAGASATLAVTVDLTDVDEPPLAPDQPDVAPVTGSTSELLVTWTAPDSTARPGVSHYDLQLKESPDGDWVDGPQGESGLSATISGLEAGTLYEVQVRAVNDEGDGAWSTPKSATTYANNAPIFSSSANVQHRREQHRGRHRHRNGRRRRRRHHGIRNRRRGRRGTVHNQRKRRCARLRHRTRLRVSAGLGEHHTRQRRREQRAHRGGEGDERRRCTRDDQRADHHRHGDECRRAAGATRRTDGERDGGLEHQPGRELERAGAEQRSPHHRLRPAIPQGDDRRLHRWTAGCHRRQHDNRKPRGGHQLSGAGPCAERRDTERVVALEGGKHRGGTTGDAGTGHRLDCRERRREHGDGDGHPAPRIRLHGDGLRGGGSADGSG